MKTENKTKLTLFIKQQLEDSGYNYQLAHDAIFGDVEFGNKTEKLAALKFLALYSSQASTFIQQSAMGVIEQYGIPINEIEVKIMTRE